MCVVSKPFPEYKFDGKLLLKRVNEWTKTKRVSCNQKISDYYHVSILIKSGEWKITCYADSITFSELVLDNMQDVYGLADYVASRLVLSYIVSCVS